MRSIRIATRNSPLAMWQANFVKQRLENEHPGLTVDIVGMTTKGDQMLDRSLAAVGGKGLFLKELEVSLLAKDTDIAVHSMKDVPVDLPQGLEIATLCEREDPRDAFVSNAYQNLYALPKGAKVGTSSLRRVSQLKNAFPEVMFFELRGNVNTRLSKLDAGDYDAIILATAGLKRLGFDDRIKQYITPELCLPAVGQGIVGIECRSDDDEVKALLKPLHSLDSELVLAAERSMNASLEGGCQVPVAGYAEVSSGKLELRGLVGHTDGSHIVSAREVSPKLTIEHAQQLGQGVASELLRQGAGEILKDVYSNPPTFKKNDEKVDKPIVVLTRQSQYLGNSPVILQRLDFHPVHVPALETEARLDLKIMEAFSRLETYTDVIFVSRNAVEIGMKMIDQQGGMPESVQVMAVGVETAKQLYGYGIDASFPEKGTGAKALLNVSQMKDLTNRRILIVRGEVGLDWPAVEMSHRGAEVEEVRCYRQGIPADCTMGLQDVFKHNQVVKGIFVHSSQSLKNLVEAAGDTVGQLTRTNLVVGSETIKNVAIELGWKGQLYVAESPSNKHMMISFSSI